MNDIRLSPPSLLMIVAVVGAAAFAAGRTMPADAPVSASPAPATRTGDDQAPAPHPAPPRAEATTGDLPPGHPAVDPGGPSPADPASGPESALRWKAPARWQLAPNASPMRIATYRIPHAAGDAADPELVIVRAGGTVEANADRWVGQFDPAGQKTAKRSTRKVAGLDVMIVEVQGTFSGGMMMNKDAPQSEGWALLGAIVATPDMPHFFKLTGPAKSVAAAKGEFDALVASLTPK